MVTLEITLDEHVEEKFNELCKANGTDQATCATQLLHDNIDRAYASEISIDTTKEYLGDSVYASIDLGLIKLVTSNGFTESNTIYLEPFVMNNLMRYALKRNFLASKESSNDEPT